ncbi:primase-like DNA-binding domain-containing protein [Caviibacterium pharyngocola]|uniref:primase-like DNA-binding domain-containing protein n=1 Tax=Caviibacterium pharyngocola TaxID=28159 RepID=UPI0013FD8698|nr:primase-like DNA-binding domain-containing protein [Caviibacterium pharyngocola]
MIILFDRKVPDGKVDPYFLDKVRAEIYGIVKFLAAQFPIPDAARKILVEYKDSIDAKETKKHANHLIEFADVFEVRKLPENPDRQQLKDNFSGLIWGSARSTKQPHETLYLAYLFFCDCMNIKPIPLNTFKSALPDALKETGQQAPIQERVKDGYLVTNIYWKTPHQDTFKRWES